MKQETRQFGCASVLVSLGSKRMSEYALSLLVSKARADGVSGLQVVLLDEAELLNCRLLFGQNQNAAESMVEERSIRVRSCLQGLVKSDCTIEVSSVTELRRSCPSFGSCWQWVSEMYENDRKFRNTCIAQTFQNLDPVLRARGVTNRRHLLVEKLSSYIVTELAVQIYLMGELRIECEYSIFKQMAVTISLFRGDFGLPGGFPQNGRVLLHRQVPVVSEGEALRVHEVAYQYSGRSGFSLDECSFLASAGTVLGIYGPSGSGKSTLLRLIAGHLEPDKGAIAHGGQALTDIPAGLRRVITVFQQSALFPNLSVRGNVAFGLELQRKYTRSQVGRLVAIYLARLGLTERSSATPMELSVGERQRVAIARALIVEPRILLLDEPTASLDLSRKAEIERLLTRVLSLPHVPIVIVVSHDRDFLFSVSDELLIMEDGRILEAGAKERILCRPSSVRVAELLGVHGRISGRLRSETEIVFIDSAGEHIAVDLDCVVSMEGESSDFGTILVPADAVSVVQEPGGLDGVRFSARVTGEDYDGGRARLRVSLSEDDDVQFRNELWIAGLSASVRSNYPLGSTAELVLKPTQCHFVYQKMGLSG